MLEPKDLEMISTIFHQSLQPLINVNNIVLKKVAQLESDVATLKTEVADLKADVATLKTEVAQLKTNVTDLQNCFSDLNQRVLNIELTLENETNKNIRIIAEGHLDLSRRFNEASKISEEDEMMKLRVTTLENEVRKIKTHLEIA